MIITLFPYGFGVLWGRVVDFSASILTTIVFHNRFLLLNTFESVATIVFTSNHVGETFCHAVNPCMCIGHRVVKTRIPSKGYFYIRTPVKYLLISSYRCVSYERIYAEYEVVFSPQFFSFYFLFVFQVGSICT